jgi:hypothetical protein
VIITVRGLPSLYRAPPVAVVRLIDMTPAEIHKKFGGEVASYVVILRASVMLWKSLAHREQDKEP